MAYPEAVNLPFNGEVIRDDFTPVIPVNGDTAGEGFWVILQGSALVVRQENDRYDLHEGALPPWAPADSRILSVGLWKGKPLWVLRVGKGVALPSPYVAEPFNAVEQRLDDRLLTVGGLAQQILHWERLSAVCSLCGNGMERIPGTWGKRCVKCGHEHYPHIHPCIIVLVRRGDEFLLTRKAEWVKGRYSLIAGFLDFGESLEECVHREVREEAGIAVKNLRYVGSQNWPFPSQLMAGFVADYAGGDLVIDPGELEDGRWFCREDMPEALPPTRSIARWIIDRYALGKS